MQTKTPAQWTGVSNSMEAILLEGEIGPGQRVVEANLALDRPGLQRERLVGAADQPVAAEADAKSRFGRGAHIGAGEGMALGGILGRGENEPGNLGLGGEAD